MCAIRFGLRPLLVIRTLRKITGLANFRDLPSEHVGRSHLVLSGMRLFGQSFVDGAIVNDFRDVERVIDEAFDLRGLYRLLDVDI